MTFQKHICLCHANSYQYPGVRVHVCKSQEPEICGFETSLDYTMRLHGEVMGRKRGSREEREGKGRRVTRKKISSQKGFHHPRRIPNTQEVFPQTQKCSHHPRKVFTTPEGFPPPREGFLHPRRVFPGASSQSVLTHTLQACFHCSWFSLF